MTKKPNPLQKIIHLIAMQRFVTDFFSTRLHKIDEFVLKATKDRHSLSAFLGWPVFRIITIGAKTGLRRNLLINGFPYGDNIILIGSSFGRRHNPGWYYNLKKNPECEVQLNGRSGKYIAREATDEERKACWQVALTYYVGYERYKERASHRIIPVLLLEPVK